MAKLILSICMLCMSLFGVSGASAAESGQSVYVVANSCYVYETASFDEQLEVNGTAVSFSHGDELTFVGEDGDFYNVSFTYEQEKLSGYVYKYYVTENQSAVTIYPVFNATVEKDSVVYDLDFVATAVMAQKGERVYLYEGYSNKTEYTAVCLVLDDGSLYYGYMLTSDISPDGVSGLLITGIMLIISCVTIVLLLVFMKKSKKRQ